MRAAAIFGLGCSPHNLKPFQAAESPENAWRIGLPATREEADAILLFGGDGTIHRHLGQLVKLGLPVLIVPAGSGNDFARALGLFSVRDALAAWKNFLAGRNNARRIDLGLITPRQLADNSPAPQESASSSLFSDRYFCSVAGVGLDADIARRANHLPRWLRGHGGYALSFAPAMFQFAPFPMKIFMANPAADCPDGDRRAADHLNAGLPYADLPNAGLPNADLRHGDLPHGDGFDSPRVSETDWTLRQNQLTLLAAFANTSTYGGGMKIAPRAQADDGLLDVCVIGSVDPFKLACLFPTVYFGRHLSVREVDYFSASRLRIETEHPLDLYADGEYVCRTPVEIGVGRGALRVICPE